jgi:hypothetical protein
VGFPLVVRTGTSNFRFCVPRGTSKLRLETPLGRFKRAEPTQALGGFPWVVQTRSSLPCSTWNIELRLESLRRRRTAPALDLNLLPMFHVEHRGTETFQETLLCSTWNSLARQKSCAQPSAAPGPVGPAAPGDACRLFHVEHMVCMPQKSAARSLALCSAID